MERVRPFPFSCLETLCFQTISKTRLTKAFTALLALFALFGGMQHAWADATVTVTTLAVTSGGSAVTTVTAGSVITLTATVTGSGNPIPQGTVNFCDASAAGEACTDIHRIGTAQLTSAGTAVVKFISSNGYHAYYAAFVGSRCAANCPGGNYYNLASRSNAAFLDVTVNTLPTSTTIEQAGSTGNYTLTAAVGYGNYSPSGAVSFLDTSNANYVLATVPVTDDLSSTGVSFLSTPAPSLYAPPEAYDGNVIAVGDLNGDGIPDLAILGTVGSVTVMLGNGDGTYVRQAPLEVGVDPFAIAVGDLNGDGIPDLAVSDSTDNTVSVLLGNGDGTFQSQVRADTNAPTGTNSSGIAIGDFNGDGKLDLVTVNTYPYTVETTTGQTTISLLLGNGDGTYQQGKIIQVNNFPLSNYIVVGDFNGDGIADLAVASFNTFENSGVVTELLGNGDGSFHSPANVEEYTANPSSAPVAAENLVIADFNEDGIPDLAVMNGSFNTVLIGNGDGSFKPPAMLSAVSGPEMGVGDFNGDGIPDFIEAGDTSALVMLGQGDGTFLPLTVPIPGTSTTHAPYAYVTNIAVADINGDGITDLVAIEESGLNSTIAVTLQTLPSQTVSASGISPPGGGSHQVVASYSGDGNHAPSLSSPISLTGQPVNPGLTLAASPSSSVYGQQVTLVATLSPYNIQSYSTDGDIVTFSSGPIVLGTGTLSSGVATLNISSMPVGSSTFNASYAGDSNFTSSSSNPLTYVVAPAPPTISFTVPNHVYGDAPFSVLATSNSGGSLTYSVLSGNATITGSQVTLTGVGPVTLLASQAASGNYSVGTQTAIFNVAGAPPTISLSVPDQTYGNQPFTLSATSNSTGYISYSILNGPAVINGSTISLTGVGTVTIQTMQASAGNYAYGTITTSFNVNAQPPGYYIFPSTVVGTNSTTQLVSFYFPNGTPNQVAAIAALTTGAPNLDYSLASNQPANACTTQAYAPGTTCSLNVVFTPLRPGTRQGAVVLNDSNGNALATAYLSGTGVGSEITFPSSAPASTTYASLQSPYGIAIDALNNIYAVSNQLGGYPVVMEYLAGGGTKTLGNGITGPTGICLDGAGNVYVGGNNYLYKIAPSGQQTTVIGLSGLGDDAGASQGHYCAVDSNSNLYVTESGYSTGVIVLNLPTGNFSPLYMGGFNAAPLSGITIDASNNIYLADEFQNQVLIIPAGGGSPNILQDSHTNYVQGLAVDPAGNLFVSTAYGQLTEYPGGNLPGIQLERNTNFNQIAFDNAGNLYIADFGPNGYYGTLGSIDKLHLTDVPAMQFGSVNIGATGTTQSITVGNSGNAPLSFSAITPSNGFMLDSSNTCTTASGIAMGATCNLAVDFQPVTSVSGGTLTLADNASNLPNPQLVSLSGSTPQSTPTITVSSSAGNNLNYSTALTILVNVAGTNGTATGSITFSVNGSAPQGPMQLVNGAASLGLGVLNAGTYTIAVSYSGDNSYTAGSAASPSIVVNPATLNITAPTISMVAGAPVPTLTPTYSGFVNGDTVAALATPATCSTTASSGSATGTYPVTCTGASAVNYTIASLPGTITVTNGTAEKISFSALPDVTYGVAPITLNATASSALPVSYAVLQGNAVITPVGSGYALTILGVGAVTVEARQSGNTTYAPAQSVDRTFNVAPHALSVVATNQKRAAGQPDPTFTYTLSGFVNGDTAAVLSGAPLLSTNALESSPAGTYNINIAVGTLSAANYELELVPGILTITSAKTGTAQKISFGTIGNRTYGSAAFTLSASANSGLPVSFTVISGPATLASNLLTITGVGTVVVEADQAGNSAWEAADPVQRVFVVSPKILSVTAASARRPYAQPNPIFAYTITGFVNGDTSASITGSPTLSSAATSTSDAGTYTIAISAGSLSAANYTFDLEPGTLTVTTVSQTLSFPALGTVTYGSSPIALAATASSGLPVTYQVVGASSAASLNGSVINILATGTITIQATQAGNIDYQTASVTRTLTIKAAPLVISADNINRNQGDPNPTLTWSVNGFVYGDQPGILTGTPVLTTTAKTSSPVGTYPIRISAGTLVAPPNYVLQFVNGTLNVNSNISF